MKQATREQHCVIKERDGLIDAIKAIAIILVVVGHCIQYGSGDTYRLEYSYYDNWLFRLIYSFHMPLFMIISGYLFYYSVQKCKHVFEIVVKKFDSLIIPVLIWSFLMYLCNCLSLSDEKPLYEVMCGYFKYTITNLWFLWALFFCSIIVAFVNKYMGDNLLFYILLIVLSFFAPDAYNIYLYKFTFPFFLSGYFFNKNHSKLDIINVKSGRMFCLFIALFCVLYVFFDSEKLVYLSGFSIFQDDGKWAYHFYINVYRFIIGLVGAVTVILAFAIIYPKINNRTKKILSFIGQRTMGIYIVSTVLFIYVLKNITIRLPWINYWVLLFESVVMVAISLAITSFLQEKEIIGKLLLGCRRDPRKNNMRNR